LPMQCAKLHLYEHSPHLLGPFEPKLQAYAKGALEERGVAVHCGVSVSKVGPTSIELSTGEKVKTHTLVWAAGLQANPVTATLGIELAHGGRVPVDGTLRLAGQPNCFAIGDIAAATSEAGRPLPGLGAVALQAGHYVGEAIKQLLASQQPPPFHYVDKGTMAQVGRGAAVVELPGGRTMTGLLAWVTWLGVHLSLLNGAEEKSTAFVDWGWNLLTHERGKRILLSDENES
jgi:NADH:ubiquinone reductase (H+-translocating)